MTGCQASSERSQFDDSTARDPGAEMYMQHDVQLGRRRTILFYEVPPTVPPAVCEADVTTSQVINATSSLLPAPNDAAQRGLDETASHRPRERETERDRERESGTCAALLHPTYDFHQPAKTSTLWARCR